jgi:hypothetical protein
VSSSAGAPTTRSSSSAVVRSIRFHARPRPRLLRRTYKLHMPTVLDGRLRAEWPVAPHVLHTDACRSSGDAITSRFRFPFGFYSFLRSTCVQRLGAVGAYCARGPIAPLHCIANTCAHGMRGAWRLGGLTCRMLCLVGWDILRRCGHVRGNVRTLTPLHAALLHMRFVSTRAAYADSSVWALARRIASCTACAARGMGTSLFAGDAQIARTTYDFFVFLRAESACSARFGCAASANHRW